MAIFAACRRTRGNDYILVSPGEHGAVDIFSAGPDAEANTADDISNWSFDKKDK